MCVSAFLPDCLETSSGKESCIPALSPQCRPDTPPYIREVAAEKAEWWGTGDLVHMRPVPWQPESKQPGAVAPCLHILLRTSCPLTPSPQPSLLSTPSALPSALLAKGERTPHLLIS